jgi:hypothetical protein
VNSSTRCRLSAITPIGSLSRRSGTPSAVRRPALTVSGNA